MSREQLHQNYKARINQFREAIQHKTRRIDLISLARLAVLVALIWSLVLGVRDNQLLFYLLSFLLLVLFLVLVSIFNKQKAERELLRQLHLLNEKELSCLDHDFQDLPDGSEFADTFHPWSHDLDLFGKGSLFQYLSRTATRKGTGNLADLLTREPSSAREIQERQRIVTDLKDRIDFRQHFTASGHLINEKPGDLEDINSWLESSAYISKHRWLFYVALGVSVLSLSLAIWMIFDPSRYWYLLYLILLNLLLLSPFFHRTQQYQQVISKKHELLEGYAGLLKQIAQNSFQHPELQKNGAKARVGMREVARLSSLMQVFDQRLNMLLGVILNGLFLFDFIMVHLLERWKSRKSGRRSWSGSRSPGGPMP